MPTRTNRLSRSTERDNFSGGTQAPLPMRLRAWIRLADEPRRVESTEPGSQYRYGMFGEVTQTVGTLASDFQYAGFYFHAPSGLNLTTYRAYNPTLGRWINRDPIGEHGGTNLYAYCNDDPINDSDPDGTLGEGLGGIIGGIIQGIGNALGIGGGGPPPPPPGGDDPNPDPKGKGKSNCALEKCIANAYKDYKESKTNSWGAVPGVRPLSKSGKKAARKRLQEDLDLCDLLYGPGSSDQGTIDHGKAWSGKPGGMTGGEKPID